MKNFRSIKNHFFNSLIWEGRKLAADRFMTKTFVRLKKLIVVRPYDVFYYSVLNLRPLVFLRPVKVGSVVYRAPAPITDHKRRLYAIKFIMQAIRNARGSITVERFSGVLLAIYQANKNTAYDKKLSLYKEALDNRSFIRFLRWKG